MSKELSRRDFLVKGGRIVASAMGATALGVGLGEREYLRKEFAPSPLEMLQGNESLTVKGALRFAERMDKLADKIEGITPEFPVGSSTLGMWNLEIAPYFVYEGIVGEDCPKGDQPYFTFACSPPTETYAKVIFLQNYFRTAAFHVGGRASCSEGSMSINVRYANPVSPKYQSAAILGVMVHEMAHINGICGPGDLMEPAAQCATVEVLAAMTRHKNKYTLVPFLKEMQGFAEDFAYSKLLDAGEGDKFRKHLERTADSAFNLAGYAKSRDFWKNDMEQLKYILRAYGKVPYLLMVGAMRNPDYKTLAIDNIPNRTHRIEMNDTAYVLEHAEELVKDYPKIL